MGLISIPPLLKNLPHTSNFSCEYAFCNFENISSIHCSWNSPLSLNEFNKLLSHLVSILVDERI